MNKFVILVFTSYLVMFSSLSLVGAPIIVDGKEKTYQNKLERTLMEITNHFGYEKFIHIVMSEDYSKKWFWDDLIKKDLFEKWSIAITHPNIQVDGITDELPDVYVIFFNNYESLIQLCNILHNVSESWNPGAKFLLVTTITEIHPKAAIDEFVINIFNDLWSRNVIRVALVIFNQGSDTSYLFSSRPYSKLFKTCKQILKFSQLQEINLLTNEISTIQVSGYQFQPPNSFLGCSLVGHTFPFPPYSIADSGSNGCRVYNSGIEVQLVKLLGNIYNFSLEILSAPTYGSAKEWLETFPNGTRAGMLDDIEHNRIDLAFAGLIFPANFYYSLSITNTYMDSSMSWYVPSAELVPMGKLVINTFSGGMWLFIFLSFFLVMLLYYIINVFEREEDAESVDLTMVALSLGFSIPWTKRSRLRLMLLAWSLFSFHVVLMFNTRLFSVLTEHPIDSEIETIQQLHDSKFKLCTYGSYLKFYTNRTDGIVSDLIVNAHICDSLDESVKVLLKYKNISILAKDDHMAFIIDNKENNVHQLKEHKFITYPVIMPVSKGSVFLGSLNRLVFNITESGLVSKWLSDVRRKLKNHVISREIQESYTESYLMTKDDFVWLYFVFLGGQSLAFIVLLIELSVTLLKAKS